VGVADYAPYSFRRAAFLDIGGLDEGASEPGQCGIISDWEVGPAGAGRGGRSWGQVMGAGRGGRSWGRGAGPGAPKAPGPLLLPPPRGAAPAWP
jgi:hypothetical protein